MEKVVKMGALGDIVTSCYGPNIFGMYPAEEGDGLLASQSSKIYQVSKRYHLPKYLKKITKNCFSFLPQLEKISVPASLSKTAEYLCDIKWKNFQVSSGNKSYKVSKGFLLSKSGKTVYGPACKKNECVNTSGCKKDI